MVIKIDRKSRELKYSSNGLPFYIISEKVRKFKTKSSTFEPEKVIKHIRSRRVHLAPEDAIFVHSDGLPDQQNEEGKKFKSRNVTQTLNSLGDNSPSEISATFLEWKGDQDQTDDVIYLYLKP